MAPSATTLSTTDDNNIHLHGRITSTIHHKENPHIIDHYRHHPPVTNPTNITSSPPDEHHHHAKVAWCIPAFPPVGSEPEELWVWSQIKAESRRDAESEPGLASFLYATVLSHDSLANSLSFHLANKLCSSTLLSTLLYDLFLRTLRCPSVMASVVADLVAARQRDPACHSYSHCLLNFKGFLAIQSHRISHALWHQNRRPMALALQSRISDIFAVDIHPAATLGRGVLLDHATGVVVGETAVIGNNVSILHHVTLGGTGKAVGDRHPKVGDGVLIGAGATILGNIRIGKGAKVGAGALVLVDVPDGCTAVGNPARILPTKKSTTCGANNHGGGEKAAAVPPAESMDHASVIQEWSDYVI